MQGPASPGSSPTDNYTSPYSGLAQHAAHLTQLSNIQPNRNAHKNRNNQFIQDGGTWSNFWGIQSAASYVKGHTPTKLVSDIEEMSNALIAKLSTDLKAAQENDAPLAQKIETIMEIKLLNSRIKRAINGTEKGGGLKGLAETYKGVEDVDKRINSVIEALEVCRAKNKDQMARLKEALEESPLDEEKLAVQGDAQKFYAVLEEENKLLPAEAVSISKYTLNYSGALYYNVVSNALQSYAWANTIGHYERGNLILGALPMKTMLYDSLSFMKQENVSAVLSVIERFENKSRGWVLAPVQSEELELEKINQLQLRSPDFETIDLETVDVGVQYIHDNLSMGKNVYVHCKAGRGRSALILMCYLIKHQNMSAAEAFAEVKEKRPQAGFKESDPKYATLLEYEKKHKMT